MQADGEGAWRSTEPRPITARQRSAADSPRARHPAPPYPLLAHHTWLRLAGHRRRHDRHPELSQRDDQVHRQELSDCRWSHSVRLGRQPQVEGQGRRQSQVDATADDRR